MYFNSYFFGIFKKLIYLFFLETLHHLPVEILARLEILRIQDERLYVRILRPFEGERILVVAYDKGDRGRDVARLRRIDDRLKVRPVPRAEDCDSHVINPQKVKVKV